MTNRKSFLYGVVLSALLLLTAPILQADVPQPAAQIITDEKAGIISILIKGKEVVRIDEAGLHVFGDMSYNGTITDGTPPHIEEKKDVR